MNCQKCQDTGFYQDHDKLENHEPGGADGSEPICVSCPVNIQCDCGIHHKRALEDEAQEILEGLQLYDPETDGALEEDHYEDIDLIVKHLKQREDLISRYKTALETIAKGFMYHDFVNGTLKVCYPMKVANDALDCTIPEPQE